MPTSCLDTLQLELSKSKTIPEEFCCKDNLTGFYQYFPFGTMLRHSEATTQKPQDSSSEQRRSRNSPSVAGSRSCARTFQQPAKEKELQENEAVYGLRWPALSLKYDRDSSSWKIHPCLFPGDWKSSCPILPRWGMMRGGVLLEEITSGPNTSESEYGSLPTPTATDWKGGRNQLHRKDGSSTQSELRHFLKCQHGLTYPIPGHSEALMIMPGGWTGLDVLEMPKFQQWLHSHGEYLAAID